MKKISQQAESRLFKAKKPLCVNGMLTYQKSNEVQSQQ